MPSIKMKILNSQGVCSAGHEIGEEFILHLITEATELLDEINWKMHREETYNENNPIKPQKGPIEEAYKKYEEDIKKNKKILDKLKLDLDKAEKLGTTEEQFRDLNKLIEDKEEELLELQKNMDRQLIEDLSNRSVPLKETPFQRINKSNEVIRQHYKENKLTFNRAIEFGKISQYDSIGELMMGRDGKLDPMLLIIYTSSSNFGHWVGLGIDEKRNRINYFNSYGSFIDKAIDTIPDEHKELSNQEFPHLLKLLSESSYEVHWNNKPLQAEKNGDEYTQTCGRWVGLFLNKCTSLIGESDEAETIEHFSNTFMKMSEEERDKIIVSITDKYLMAYKNIGEKNRVEWQ